MTAAKPRSERFERGLKTRREVLGAEYVDRSLPPLFATLRGRGPCLCVICSDHGHSPVDEHYDLPVRLETDHGLRAAYHSWPVMRRRPDGFRIHARVPATEMHRFSDLAVA